MTPGATYSSHGGPGRKLYYTTYDSRQYLTAGDEANVLDVVHDLEAIVMMAVLPE